jgi:creatinine amidohydrolase
VPRLIPLTLAAVASVIFLSSPCVSSASPSDPPAPVTSTNPLWRAPKVKNYLPDMTWPEVQGLLTRSNMVIIPVGALEQHGPQGPIGTDFYSGVERAKLIAQRTDVLVAPIVMPGNSPYHMGFPGTITLSAETLERVYFEAAQSLIQHGFRKFIFLNAHGGNAVITRFIVDRINQETSATAVDLDQAIQPFESAEHTPPAIKAELDKVPDVKGFDHHAGVGETSSSLYLIPSLVDMSVAPPPAPLTLPPDLKAMLPRVDTADRTTSLLFLSQALKAKSTGKHTSTREMTATGVWSEADPRQASAARGKAYTDSFVEASVQFIDTWKRMQPLPAGPESQRKSR